MEPQATVFVVDDCPEILSIVQSLAREKGWRVQSYSTPQAFLSGYESRGRAPACLVVDVEMPEMDGVSLLESVGAGSGVPPALVISASADRGIVNRAFAAGAMGVIRKPFDPVEFVGRIEAAIELDRRRQGGGPWSAPTGEV